MGQSVFAADKKLIINPTIEGVIRRNIKKPTGELTKADLERLTSLNCFGIAMTDAGLKELAKLKQLKTLILIDTKIMDAGLKEVAKLQKLKVLGLNGTKVTYAGVAQLKKALPNCGIGHNAKK